MTYNCRFLQVLLLLSLTVPAGLMSAGLKADDLMSAGWLNTTDLRESEIGNVLGIFITEDEIPSVSSARLTALEEAGIGIYEVEGSASQIILDFIRNSEHSLFVRQNRRFATAYQLQSGDSLYFQEDLSLINHYRNEIGAAAAAFGLFTYPDEKSPISTQLLNRYSDRFENIGEELNLYYVSAFEEIEGRPVSFSFKSTRLPGLDRTTLPSQVVHFIPDAADARSVEDLNRILDASLEENQSITFLPYSWFVSQSEQFPLFDEIIRAYVQDGNILPARQRAPDETVLLDWTVIILILLLGSYVIHYRMSAYYRHSLFRYFMNHNFFAASTIEYRLRTLVPGFIIFFQHTVICGLFVYILANSAFSVLGIEALRHHFPILSLFGEGSTDGLFFIGMLAAFILQSASVLWIQLINSKTSLAQSLTLYSWPLQLNFIIILLMTGIYQAGGADAWILLFAVLFPAVWFISFNVAALDIAKFLTRFRVLYIVFTIGLHLLVIVALLLAFLFYPPLSEPVRMALMLP